MFLQAAVRNAKAVERVPELCSSYWQIFLKQYCKWGQLQHLASHNCNTQSVYTNADDVHYLYIIDCVFNELAWQDIPADFAIVRRPLLHAQQAAFHFYFRFVKSIQQVLLPVCFGLAPLEASSSSLSSLQASTWTTKRYKCVCFEHSGCSTLKSVKPGGGKQ